MICGGGIDWSATGAMLSGLGTIIGAIAVLVAARIGANTFQSWKRQRIDERRTELAEVALTLGYKLQDAVSAIRSPVSFGEEGEAAETKLREQGVITERTSQSQLHLLRLAQVILNRITARSTLYDQLAEIRPRVRAVFGRATEEQLAVLYTVTSRVRASAIAYAHTGRDTYRSDSQLDQALARARRYEHIFWEDSQVGEDGQMLEDTIKKEVASAIKALEGVFRPHFDLASAAPTFSFLGRQTPAKSVSPV